MWCSNCQQDVPAIGQSGSAKLTCSRCHATVRSPHTTDLSEAGIPLDDSLALELVDSRPPIVRDDWQLRRRSRELGRKLRHEPTAAHRRVDAAQDVFAQIAAQTMAPVDEPAESTHTADVAQTPTLDLGMLLFWPLALLGATALAAGLGAIAWEFAHGGLEFWNSGMAMMLAGQGVLILGLLLAVARLSHHSRQANGRLQEVHVELGRLQRTADAIAATRTGGSPAFYGELVRGASPQMLLTNLKGQLDQLAARLNGQW